MNIKNGSNIINQCKMQMHLENSISTNEKRQTNGTAPAPPSIDT